MSFTKMSNLVLVVAAIAVFALLWREMLILEGSLSFVMALGFITAVAMYGVARLLFLAMIQRKLKEAIEE